MESSGVIDLTGDSPRPCSAAGNPRQYGNDDFVPIGVDLCPDMVDLADDADNDDAQIVDYQFDSTDFAPWESIQQPAKGRAEFNIESKIARTHTAKVNTATTSQFEKNVGDKNTSEPLPATKPKRTSTANPAGKKGPSEVEKGHSRQRSPDDLLVERQTLSCEISSTKQASRAHSAPTVKESNTSAEQNNQNKKSVKYVPETKPQRHTNGCINNKRRQGVRRQWSDPTRKRKRPGSNATTVGGTHTSSSTPQESSLLTPQQPHAISSPGSSKKELHFNLTYSSCDDRFDRSCYPPSSLQAGRNDNSMKNKFVSDFVETQQPMVSQSKDTSTQSFRSNDLLAGDAAHHSPQLPNGRKCDIGHWQHSTESLTDWGPQHPKHSRHPEGPSVWYNERERRGSTRAGRWERGAFGDNVRTRQTRPFDVNFRRDANHARVGRFVQGRGHGGRPYNDTSTRERALQMLRQATERSGDLPCPSDVLSERQPDVEIKQVQKMNSPGTVGGGLFDRGFPPRLHASGKGNDLEDGKVSTTQHPESRFKGRREDIDRCDKDELNRGRYVPVRRSSPTRDNGSGGYYEEAPPGRAALTEKSESSNQLKRAPVQKQDKTTSATKPEGTSRVGVDNGDRKSDSRVSSAQTTGWPLKHQRTVIEIDDDDDDDDDDHHQQLFDPYIHQKNLSKGRNEDPRKTPSRFGASTQKSDPTDQPKMKDKEVGKIGSLFNNTFEARCQVPGDGARRSGKKVHARGGRFVHGRGHGGRPYNDTSTRERALQILRQATERSGDLPCPSDVLSERQPDVEIKRVQKMNSHGTVGGSGKGNDLEDGKVSTTQHPESRFKGRREDIDRCDKDELNRGRYLPVRRTSPTRDNGSGGYHQEVPPGRAASAEKSESSNQLKRAPVQKQDKTTSATKPEGTSRVGVDNGDRKSDSRVSSAQTTGWPLKHQKTVIEIDDDDDDDDDDDHHHHNLFDPYIHQKNLSKRRNEDLRKTPSRFGASTQNSDPTDQPKMKDKEVGKIGSSFSNTFGARCQVPGDGARRSDKRLPTARTTESSLKRHKTVIEIDGDDELGQKLDTDTELTISSTRANGRNKDRAVASTKVAAAMKVNGPMNQLDITQIQKQDKEVGKGEVGKSVDAGFEERHSESEGCSRNGGDDVSTAQISEFSEPNALLSFKEQNTVTQGVNYEEEKHKTSTDMRRNVPASSEKDQNKRSAVVSPIVSVKKCIYSKMKGNVDPREENFSRAEIDHGNKSAKFGALKGRHLSAPNICNTRPRSMDQVVDSAGDEKLTASNSLDCRDKKSGGSSLCHNPMDSCAGMSKSTEGKDLHVSNLRPKLRNQKSDTEGVQDAAQLVVDEPNVAKSDEMRRVDMQEIKINSFLEQVHGFSGKAARVRTIDDDNNVIEIFDSEEECEAEEPRVRGGSSGPPADPKKSIDTPGQTIQVDLENPKGRSQVATVRPRRFKPTKKKKTARTENVTSIDKGAGSHDGERSNCSNSSRDKKQWSEQNGKHQLKLGEQKTVRDCNRWCESQRLKRNGGKSSCERRYVFHALNSGTSQQDNFLTEATKRKWFEKNFNYSFSHEDALREQERLFQESAARVKAQAQFRVVTHSEVLGRRPIKFSTLVIDVEKRHPNHWQLENPYTRLGLPNGAATTLVKSQYRRLALVYHPDKSRVEGTAVKFQAVTEAYRTLMDR